FRGWRLRPLIKEWGIDVPWANRAGAYAVPTFLGIDLLRETAQTEFGGDVGRPGKVTGDLSHVGIDVDDRAGPLRPHPRQERSDAVVRAMEGRGQDRVPVVERQHLEAPARDIDTGGIHENVDRAKPAQH